MTHLRNVACFNMPTAILQNFGNKKHFEASILATFRFYGI